MNIQYFANPHQFLRLIQPISVVCWIGALISLSAGLYNAFLASPPDYQQGDSVRIMYIHVPAAYLALQTYALIAMASGVFLIWKHPLAYIIARASVPIGFAFCAICLVSGALWGQPMWGTWWVWDARLTSVLILFILYLGLMILCNVFENPQHAQLPFSILAIAGAVNLPIIKFSVDWWSTLHQPASLLRLSGPTIDAQFLVPLITTGLGLFFLSLALLFMRIRLEYNKEKIRANVLRNQHKQI